MDKIIEREFEAKQKMPKKMKNETIKFILQNLLMVVIVLITLGLICFMSEDLANSKFSNLLKGLAIFFGGVSVIFFEISYRKEKTTTFLWAVELFVLGLILMFVPYVSSYVRNIIIGLSAGYGVYYLIKLLVIVLKKEKEFSDNKSDIKTLLKDDKTGYLDDVSEKKFKKK